MFLTLALSYERSAAGLRRECLDVVQRRDEPDEALVD
jgi:hypothetical protein